MPATHTLEDRVTKVEELTEHQNGDIAFIKEKVTYLHEANKANSRTLRGLEQEVTIAQMRTRQVEESVGSLYVKVDGLEQRVDGLAKKADALDKKLDVKTDTLEKKIDALDEKFDERFDVLEGEFKEVGILVKRAVDLFEEQRREQEDK